MPETGLVQAKIEAVELMATDPVAKHTFDQFMWDYVGHPTKPEYPRLARTHAGYGEVAYGLRSIQSFTKDGYLVHVRETLEVDGDQPEHFLVVTADLAQGTITEWWVDDVNRICDRQNRTELALRSQISDALDDDNPANILEAIKVERDRRKNLRNMARVVLSTQGCLFRPPNDDDLSLAPISELLSRVNEYQKAT